jgi:hypothetical protein
MDEPRRGITPAPLTSREPSGIDSLPGTYAGEAFRCPGTSLLTLFVIRPRAALDLSPQSDRFPTHLLLIIICIYASVETIDQRKAWK